MRPPLPCLLLVLLTAPAAADEPPPRPVTTEGAPVTAGEAEPPSEAAPANEEEGKKGEKEEKEEEEKGRITFDVSLGPGRGRVSGSAKDMDADPEAKFLLLTGGVKLKYRTLTVAADVVRVDMPEHRLTAEGNVVLDDGPRRLAGRSVEWDLEAQTGEIVEATAYVAPEFHFSGARVSKLGELDYRIEDGVFTACNQEVPDWSIRLSDARITLEAYAHIKNARLRLRKLPIFYLPYIVWPTKSERSSGLLVPNPGFSSRRGGYLGLAYYQTLGRSADTTLFGDFYSKGFYGFGQELRWRPSESSQGQLRGYVLSEPNADDLDPEQFPRRFDPNYHLGDTRWKVEFHHESNNLWKHFRGVVDYEAVSDFDYLQEFERDVNAQTRSFLYSDAYLSANVGHQSFNLLVDQREFVQRTRGDAVQALRQLPEVEYRLRNTRLGHAPVYFNLDSALHYLSIERFNATTRIGRTDQYGRADLQPSFSLPLSTLSWLSAKVDLGGRLTWYGDSLDENNSRELSGESLTRSYPFAGLEVVGPSFSRIFDKKIGRFAKLKHVIEPRWTYAFIDDFENRDRISIFDEIDTVRPRNIGTLALFNRFIAKPADESQGGAFEVASLELAQSYSFDPDQRLQLSRSDPESSTQEGPLEARFRFNPSAKTSVRLEAFYNTLFGELQSVSFSGNTAFGPHKVGLTWFTRRNPEASQTTSDQLRLFTSLVLVPKHLTLDSEVSYDAQLSQILQQRYFVTWLDQCFSVQFEWRQSELGGNFINGQPVPDRDFRFSFTLKHVGTFVDLNGNAP